MSVKRNREWKAHQICQASEPRVRNSTQTQLHQVLPKGESISCSFFSKVKAVGLSSLHNRLLFSLPPCTTRVSFLASQLSCTLVPFVRSVSTISTTFTNFFLHSLSCSSFISLIAQVFVIFCAALTHPLEYVRKQWGNSVFLISSH